MQRILQIVDSMDMGGIQAFIMNVYRKIVLEDIQFDFLTFRNHKQDFEEEIHSLGGHVYKIPGRRDGVIKNIVALNKFWKEHPEYKVVHYETSSASDLAPLYTAKRAGIKTRIIHCHSTRAPGGKIQTWIHYVNKRLISRYANIYMACGKAASEWLYGGTNCLSKCIIIYNGIDVDKYTFDESKRINIKNELGLNNCGVVGHVGRFSAVKNHKFLIDIFQEIKRKEPSAKLMLVGDGDLRQEVSNQVTHYGLQDSVVFLGIRNDVNLLLQAFDVMVFPSLHEGFPVTIIEAEAAGLPCVISDTITEEVMIKGNIKRRSLQDDPSKWADDAILMLNQRIPENQCLVSAGLDIAGVVKQLSDIYLI